MWCKIYGDDDDIDPEEVGVGREEKHVLVAASTHLLFTRRTCHCHDEDDHNDDRNDEDDDEDNDEDNDEDDDEDNGEDNDEDDHHPIWMRMTLFILTCLWGKKQTVFQSR